MGVCRLTVSQHSLLSGGEAGHLKGCHCIVHNPWFIRKIVIGYIYQKSTEWSLRLGKI